MPKEITEVLSIPKLQQDIDKAIQDMRSEKSDTWIVWTVVSSGNGVYASQKFREIFFTEEENSQEYEEHASELQREDEDMGKALFFQEYIEMDFDAIKDLIDPLIIAPAGYYLYFGFNENDGAIELFIERQLDVQYEDEMLHLHPHLFFEVHDTRYPLRVEFDKYAFGGMTCMKLNYWDSELNAWLPFGTATSNYTAEPPYGYAPPSEKFTLVKNYAENEGLLKVLEDYKICKATGKIINTGFVNLHEVEILMDFKLEG